MNTISIQQLAREIHGGSVRVIMALTGGGSGAISALLTVPGASRSILGAIVPYAESAMIDWLGSRPEEFCSPWTARAMAMRAFFLARRFQPEGEVCGVACTASLATDRPKSTLR